MEVSVLRIGHRFVRDDRITTHAALVSRAKSGTDGEGLTSVLKLFRIGKSWYTAGRKTTAK